MASTTTLQGSEVTDAESDVAAARATRRQNSRWRVLVALGLVAASWFCVASAIGILQNERSIRKAHEGQRADCGDARDAITEWGKRLAVEASMCGWLMLRERLARARLRGIEPMPFLVPGPMSSALQLERLARMANEFKQLQATVLWYPTVRLEDRAAYEAYAGDVYGRAGGIGITDHGIDFDAAYLSFPAPVGPGTLQPAPDRPTYNPATTIWVADDESVPRGWVEQFVGLDLQEQYRETLPPSLQAQFFDAQKIIGHATYTANGLPVADFSIIVFVPVLDDECVDGGACFYEQTEALEDQAPVLGYVSFSLHVDRWSSIFPAHVQVAEAASGNVIKTQTTHDSAGSKHVHAHETYLNLDLSCFHDQDKRRGTYYLGAALSVVIIAHLCWLLRILEARAARKRRMVDERRKDVARDVEAAAQRKDERIRYGFEVSEKTERYLNHELKNRIFVLGQSCAAQSLHGQINEIKEVLSSKAVLMRLSTNRYEPSWDAVKPVSLIDTRWQRFVAANSPFGRAETTGAAAHRTVLLLDKALINICLDNMLSNAFKYGDPSRPPALSLNVEPLDSEASHVRLSLELRNWTGPEHAALLQLGEEALNKIARAEGRRAHEHAAELSSGDGFPMAAAAASALGGTVRLVLLSDGVVARLELPDITAVMPRAERGNAAAAAAPVELLRLKIAMVDDSASFRKTFTRLANKVTSQEPIVAGETRESIDDFPRMVVESDVDVVFLDNNFAPVHHTKSGVDLCRECRQLDAEEGNVPRLIFIVSANDSPEDAERYRAAGADGSLGKELTSAVLRLILDDAVPRRKRASPPSETDAITV